MGRYDFVSPGGMAGRAIEEFLIQRELYEQQQMRDAQQAKTQD